MPLSHYCKWQKWTEKFLFDIRNFNFVCAKMSSFALIICLLFEQTCSICSKSKLVSFRRRYEEVDDQCSVSIDFSALSSKLHSSVHNPNHISSQICKYVNMKMLSKDTHFFLLSFQFPRLPCKWLVQMIRDISIWVSIIKCLRTTSLSQPSRHSTQLQQINCSNINIRCKIDFWLLFWCLLKGLLEILMLKGEMNFNFKTSLFVRREFIKCRACHRNGHSGALIIQPYSIYLSAVRKFQFNTK